MRQSNVFDTALPGHDQQKVLHSSWVSVNTRCGIMFLCCCCVWLQDPRNSLHFTAQRELANHSAFLPTAGANREAAGDRRQTTDVALQAGNPYICSPTSVGCSKAANLGENCAMFARLPLVIITRPATQRASRL